MRETARDASENRITAPSVSVICVCTPLSKVNALVRPDLTAKIRKHAQLYLRTAPGQMTLPVFARIAKIRSSTHLSSLVIAAGTSMRKMVGAMIVRVNVAHAQILPIATAVKRVISITRSRKLARAQIHSLTTMEQAVSAFRSRDALMESTSSIRRRVANVAVVTRGALSVSTRPVSVPRVSLIILI